MSKEFYDNFFASGYHRSWQDAPGKLVVLGYVLEHLQKGHALLDIGCGDGFFLSRIVDMARERGMPISGSGLDISMKAINLARSAYPALDFSVMDAESLDYDFSMFNIVVSYGVFEHISNPQKGIEETSRVLSSGGIFAMMMPTVGSYRQDRLDEGWYEDLNDPPQMQWNYRRDKWEEFFDKVGLKLLPIEESVKYGAINPGNFYFGRKL